jgi:hypothetical protein
LLRTIVRLPCLLLIVALHGRNISEFFQLFHITLRSALFLVSERAGSHFANGQPRSKSRAALGSFADIDDEECGAARCHKRHWGTESLDCPLWVISGHVQHTDACPLSATSRHSQGPAQIERPPRGGPPTFPPDYLFRRLFAPSASFTSRADPTRRGRCRRL